jgi:hypothetical protein
MSRRTFAQVRAAAIATERAAARAYAETYIGEVRGQIEKGRISASEGDMLVRRIRAFADGLEQGLHVDG